MRTVTILGCGGFIGSHTLERLLTATDDFVIGVDVNSQKIEKFLTNPRFSFVRQNIFTGSKIEKFIEKSDLVISLAAICNPALYNTKAIDVINSSFTNHLDLLKICTETGTWLIHFSTSEVYGKTLSHFTGSNAKKDYVLNEDESMHILGPTQSQRWSYANAKQLMERLIYAYHQENNLKFTIVRPFNFIGPRMDYLPEIEGGGIPRVLACFMDALIFNKPLQLVDGGKNKRVFTYICNRRTHAHT